MLQFHLWTKTNLIAIAGFLFTVVLINIVSETPLNNIFTKDITAIIELILLCSAGYWLINLFEIKYKLYKINESYVALKNNYEQILSKTDIEDIFENDKLINETKNSIKKSVLLFSILWVVFIIITIIVIENISEYPIIFNFFKWVKAIIFSQYKHLKIFG